MQSVGEFPSEGFIAAWNLGGKRGETEHKVAVSPGSKTIRKFGTEAINHTWTDYLQRLALHNSLFPGTAYFYKGLSTIEGRFAGEKGWEKFT
jgi:hypothetical protein